MRSSSDRADKCSFDLGRFAINLHYYELIELILSKLIIS